ncbi:MAG: hypothetical protein Q8L85_03370 [Alphaproteobacteria bacterium]|nr:hypothetical protein [Alphaproteobacteria bacterium]
MKRLLKTLSMLVICITISNASWALNADKLKELGENYIQFMSSIGKGEEFASKMPGIFHPDCEKIENGTLLLNTFDGHVAQLQKAFDFLGCWTIEPLNILPTAMENKCVIYFKWYTDKLEPHATMAILSFNEDGFMTKIDEMWNKYQSKTLVSDE